MSLEEKKFKNYLQKRGLKFTPQRKTILREVFSTHKHFRADDIFLRVTQKRTCISRASVYRTIELLVKSGLLRQVISGEKHRHYEHTFGHDHHDHLFCLGCGKVIEFKRERIEKLQEEVCRQHGFKPLEHRLQILGYCNKCG